MRLFLSAQDNEATSKQLKELFSLRRLKWLFMINSTKVVHLWIFNFRFYLISEISIGTKEYRLGNLTQRKILLGSYHKLSLSYPNKGANK